MKLGNSSAAMGVGVYFFILRLRVSGRGWQVGAWVALSVAWGASCSLLVRRAQVAILYVCYEWRICSVWQVAWERMNGCSYIIERAMQSSPPPFFGRVVWGTTRREPRCDEPDPNVCAIDVRQLLTIVIAGVCRVEFSSLLICNEWRICSIW